MYCVQVSYKNNAGVIWWLETHSINVVESFDAKLQSAGEIQLFETKEEAQLLIDAIKRRDLHLDFSSFLLTEDLDNLLFEIRTINI